MECEHVRNGAGAAWRFEVDLTARDEGNEDCVVWLCADCYDRLKGAVLQDIANEAVGCIRSARMDMRLEALDVLEDVLS
jgi:hypothetical protein